jgi:hypothetical protein
LDIIVIGDSIIKNIQPRKLSRKNVHKYTFPEKTAKEIEKENNFAEGNNIRLYALDSTLLRDNEPNR